MKQIKKKLPIGIENFAKLQAEDFYYVDKTMLIKELLDNWAEVNLFTRPRRFGKTLNMSMLKAFFELNSDKNCFRDTRISREVYLCEQYMGKFPVIFISLKSISAQTYEKACDMAIQIVNGEARRFQYLLDSERLTEYDKDAFKSLLLPDMKESVLCSSLRILSELLEKHHGQKVILLIDEYDVPIAKANAGGYYRQMLDMMKGLMQALKDNCALKFAVVTGCLKIAKESIFTGTNNFVSDSVADSRLTEYFGFVQSEVDEILKDAHILNQSENIRKWYDGYHFGDVDVYCPWDVMNYVLDLQRKPDAKPLSYWRNTSDNAIIRSFIDYAGSSITQKLETLLSGGYIVQQVDENLTYDYLHSSEENLWSILYLTGYLTSVRADELENPLPDRFTALTIPNEEIKEIYETTVIRWFDESAPKWNRSALFDAVWKGNIQELQGELNRLLRRTISYHDYKEDFYHAFLAGIFA